MFNTNNKTFSIPMMMKALAFEGMMLVTAMESSVTEFLARMMQGGFTI